MTDSVIKKIQNITKYIPLDWTVNGAAKAFLKSKFSEWYSSCIVAQLYEGKLLKMSKLNLSVLKLVQTKWIMDLFNYLTSEKGRGITSNGWKAAFTTKAICSDLNGLKTLDGSVSGDRHLGYLELKHRDKYPV